MNKTIFILLDGCTYDGAKKNMGYLEHLIEFRKGIKFKCNVELPAVSRPIYETLFTGLPVSEHLIVNNDVVKLSKEENIFSLCKKSNLKTAASAFSWISELYNKSPFDLVEDRFQVDPKKNIQAGIFYYEGSYPDKHIINDGEYLRRKYDPDFLFIHSMSIDFTGHAAGGDSGMYAGAVSSVDMYLSFHLPKWMEEGYNIVITSDHGMNENRMHGGNDYMQRCVPVYIFPNQGFNMKIGDFGDVEFPQLYIAPLLCKFLGIEKSKKMKSLDNIYDLIF